LFDNLAGHKDGITAAKDLADIIFKVGGIGVTVFSGGYICLMKWLDGKKPDSIVQSINEVHIYKGNEYFVADKKALLLAESIAVRKQSEKLLSALDRDGIDRISILRKDEAPLIIQKDDVSSFCIPESDEESEVLEDKEIEMFLQIDSLSFKEGNKWKMTQGDESFFVIIEDASFLKKVHTGDIAFAINDVLRCKVKERQLQTIKGNLKKDRRITKVLEYRQGGKQLKLL
jgi:hypothetical protein